VLLLGALVWFAAGVGAYHLLRGSQGYPDAVILGDKVCVLKDYESAVFDIGGGKVVFAVRLPQKAYDEALVYKYIYPRPLWVIGLPKEVKNMPVCQRGGKP